MANGTSPYGSRGRSLDRFEESLKRLDPPPWMKAREESTESSLRSSQTTITTPNDLSFRLSTSSRPRYSDHRRSYSAQRSGTTSASSSLWRTENAGTPSSRGPSPAPGSRPATAGGRFQSSSYSRWSASTLCSDSNCGSTGNNTPTESIISAFSMRSNGTNTEPVYHPPPTASHNFRALNHMQRPYLGWRSQESLVDDDLTSKYSTPAERLASSYRRGQIQQARKQRESAVRNHHSLPRNCIAEQLYVHESIKSVSSAIMEFCQAQDVPAPPPPQRRRSGRSKDGINRPKIVWLESSFVSSTPATTVNKNSSESKL
jgi:hypothetical protein